MITERERERERDSDEDNEDELNGDGKRRGEQPEWECGEGMQ